MAHNVIKKQKIYEQVSVSSAQAIKQSTLSKEEKNQLAEAITQQAKQSGNSKLMESASNLVEKGFGKSKWSFPISRFDHVNINRRNYPKGLWERVINEQKHVWEGGTGLADHPVGDEDPAFKDTAVVWSNLRMDESNNLVWADAIFVGDNGKLAEEILENGGKVGFSTAGMGDLEKVTENTENGLMEFYNVVPEEFILERVADVVHNPSQDVYGFLDMKISESNHDMDPARTQKLHPAGDEREPTTNEEHVPVQGEEPSQPEFSETDGLEEPHGDEIVAGDTSLQEAGTTDNLNTNNILDYVKKLKDADKVWVDGDGQIKYSKGGNSHDLDAKTRAELASRGLKEDGTVASGSVGVDSAGFQAAAPENAVATSSPGRKEEEDDSQEGTTMSESRPSFDSYEERRAYDDILKFLEKADNMDSPQERLKEYKEISSYIQDMKFGEQLNKTLQQKIKKTQGELSDITETGSQFRKVFGTDVSVKDLQGAISNLSEVKDNLSETTYDWKKVATKMANQLRKFVEAVQILKQRPTIEAHENLRARSKKVQETLSSRMQKLERAKDKKITNLQGDLTKAHKALRASVQEKKELEASYQKKLNEMRKKNKQLIEHVKKVEENANAATQELMGEETRYLFEGGKGVANKAQAHQVQNKRIHEQATEKYRNTAKQEVKEYYDQLLRKHGAAIVPHSQEILECNNYREAVNKFMEIMDRKTDVSPESILDMDNPMIYEAIQNMYDG